MFGYVTPLKPELKIREYEMFKSYYCGVCTHIKEYFGNIPRLTLNYDMAFLGVLLDALHNESPSINFIRCIAHQLNKKPMILNNKALEYAAAMNVSLVYYKFIDDVNDDKDIKSKMKILVLEPYKRKFNRNVTNINDIIEENLKLLSELEENKNFTSIDEIANPFSLIVAKILELYPETFEGDCQDIRYELYDLGYALGKWIYLIDALDDLKEDMEKKKFNPINFLYNKENKSYDDFIKEIKPRIEFTILNCGYNCKESLEKLPLKRNKEILQNIINLGMMDKYEKVINSCNCKDKKKRVDR